MFIHFFCLCPLGLATKLNFNISKDISKEAYLQPLKLPGGGLPYETDRDARRKIRIKPLKETNLGVAQA